MMSIAQAKKPDVRRPRAKNQTTSIEPTALSHAQIDQTRTSLSREIQALEAGTAATRHRLDQVHHSLFREGPDEIDQSTGRIIFDEGVALTEQTTARLDSCRHALDRIESGSYGTCEQCQQPIDPERLLALPRATTCLSCASLGNRHATIK